MDNPALTRNEMALLLKNRSVPAGLLARVGRHPGWTRHYEVCRRIVRHRRTPWSVSRGLVGRLYWRDLADVVEDTGAHPALRRRAERILCERLPDLALGERVALARKATPDLIAALGRSGETPVYRVLLGNPRLRATDAAGIAASEDARGEVLRLLAGHANWGKLRAVQLALVRNPRTPVAVALKLLSRLAREDLKKLGEEENVPQIVRVGARRQLETHSGSHPEGRGSEPC